MEEISIHFDVTFLVGSQPVMSATQNRAYATYGKNLQQTTVIVCDVLLSDVIKKLAKKSPKTHWYQLYFTCENEKIGW